MMLEDTDFICQSLDIEPVCPNAAQNTVIAISKFIRKAATNLLLVQMPVIVTVNRQGSMFYIQIDNCIVALRKELLSSLAGYRGFVIDAPDKRLIGMVGVTKGLRNNSFSAMRYLEHTKVTNAICYQEKKHNIPLKAHNLIQCLLQNAS